jgi:calcium release-activated calcium channel protein 1
MASIIFNDQVMWETKCRQEDMQQRALENERRAIDDARRAVDEKAQQLKTLSHQSALIAGFCMILIVEIQIPSGLHPALLISFGITSTLVVSLMLISMLNATFLLVSILRYDTVAGLRGGDNAQPAKQFKRFWTTRCESDWRLALRSFIIGVPLFCVVLAQIGWVKLWHFDDGAWIWASSCISIIAISIIMVYLLHTGRKWIDWLLKEH